MSTDNEQIDILHAQVVELIDILMTSLASEEVDACDLGTALQRYRQQVEQIATTAETLAWTGLHNICVLYQAALVPLISNPPRTDNKLVESKMDTFVGKSEMPKPYRLTYSSITPKASARVAKIKEYRDSEP